MKTTRIYTNDKLVKNEDGEFFYTDTYGETTEIGNLDSFFSWAADEEIEVSDELKAWLEN